MEIQRIIKWGVLAALLYIGYSYAWPVVQERLNRSMSSSPRVIGIGEGADCVRLAQRALDDYTSRVTRYKPGSNPDRLLSSLASSTGLIEHALQECRCRGRSCELGQSAMESLEEESRRFRRLVTEKDITYNPARSVQGIQSTLDRARVEANAESPL